MRQTTSPSKRVAGIGWVAAAILTGQLTMAFGMFAVSVALPKIMIAFSASVNTIQWVMTGYLIARAVPTPALGWLSDRIGKQQLYVAGILGVTLCTILCGLSWNMTTLIVFRSLQGALGAPAMAIGTVILYEAFPDHKRGLAMGLLILVASLGPTIGQLLGGYLVDMLSWRAIFFLGVPSGVISVLLTLIKVPRETPSAQKSLDLPGLCTMTIFLVALLLALSQGQRQGWDSSYIRLLLLGSVLSLGLFLVIERRVAHPIVHLQLYRNRSFVMASLVVFLYNAGFMGANFLVALMLQRAFDFTSAQAGLILAPGALAMGLVGFFSGKLSDRFDPRLFVFAGLVCFVLNLLHFSSLTLLVSIGMMTVLVLVQRAGFGMIHASINTVILRTLPATERSMGSGLHALHRGIGMAFGVALCSTLLEKRLAVHTVLMTQQHDRLTLPIEQTLNAFQSGLHSAGAVGQSLQTQALAALQNLMHNHVRIAAYADCYGFLALLFLVALLPVWWIRLSTPPRSVGSPAAVSTPTGVPAKLLVAADK